MFLLDIAHAIYYVLENKVTTACVVRRGREVYACSYIEVYKYAFFTAII